MQQNSKNFGDTFLSLGVSEPKNRKSLHRSGERFGRCWLALGEPSITKLGFLGCFSPTTTFHGRKILVRTQKGSRFRFPFLSEIVRHNSPTTPRAKFGEIDTFLRNLRAFLLPRRSRFEVCEYSMNSVIRRSLLLLISFGVGICSAQQSPDYFNVTVSTTVSETPINIGNFIFSVSC